VLDGQAKKVAVFHFHHGLTDISLGPPAVGQHEGNPPEPLHPEPVKEFSRHHGQSGSGVRERQHRL
jgi:hypothetical protein